MTTGFGTRPAGRRKPVTNAEVAAAFAQAGRNLCIAWQPFIDALGKAARQVNASIVRARQAHADAIAADFQRQMDLVQYGRDGDLIGPMMRDIRASEQRASDIIDAAYNTAMRKLCRLQVELPGKPVVWEEKDGHTVVFVPEPWA